MVDLRFRHFSRHQVQHRQQHGSHGVERIRVGDVRVFLHADLRKQVDEFVALQERQRMHAFVVEQVEQYVPVGIAQIHQLTQCLDFLVGEDHFRMFTAQTQRVVEEHLMHLHHV